MIPITPSGMRMRPTRMPFGRPHIRTISPTGSGNAAISSRPAAVCSITLSERVSLSSIAADKPAALPASRSFRFTS